LIKNNFPLICPPIQVQWGNLFYHIVDNMV
jgi:hypothetical protein